jgi:hypothetical protein
MKLFIHTKVFFNISDQQNSPTSLVSVFICEKIGWNWELNFVSVQLIGTSKTLDGGGPYVKLEKCILILTVGKIKSIGILPFTVA